MTHEESEDLEFRKSHVGKKFNEMDGCMLKELDLSCSQINIIREMENKKNENKEGIKEEDNKNIKEQE